MNALIQKELRLVLPAFIAALVMIGGIIILHVITGAEQDSTLLPFTFCAAAVVVALSSFGREFSLATFTFQMAQPIPRRTLWRTKLAVLSVCVAGLLVVGWASVKAWVPVPFQYGDTSPIVFSTLAALVFATATGALWSTLLLRQIVAAFWFALLLPWALVLASATVKFYIIGTNAALLVYAVAGFFLAARLFGKAQDANWTGGELALPFGRVTQSGQRSRRPWRALVFNEMKSHQIILLGMGAMFILHVVAVLARKDAEAKGGVLDTVLNFVPFLWIFVPLLAGGMSVAEERRMGTLDTFHALPVSRTKRIMVKALVAVAIGGLLSSILLIVAESIARFIGAPPDVGLNFSENLVPVLVCALFAVSFIAFYASTLSRNVLQAFGIAIPIAALALVLLNVGPRSGESLEWWDHRIFHVITWPVLFLAIAWLIRSNFAHASVGWALWKKQLVVLIPAVCVACFTTAAVYHRAWELFIQLEPSHGPAKLAWTTTSPPRLLSSPWAAGILVSLTKNGMRAHAHEPYSSKMRSSSPVLEGHWVDAGVADRRLVGIRSDGTLWVSSNPAIWDQSRNVFNVSGLSSMVRCGTESNWSQIVRAQSCNVLLSSRDGSLWRLGPRKTSKTNSTPLHIYAPVELDGGRWERIVSAGFIHYAWRHSGKAYVIRFSSGTGDGSIEIEKPIYAQRMPTLDHMRVKAVAWSGTGTIALLEDGSLWHWRYEDWPLVSARVLLDPNPDWISISGEWRTLVGLKKDGSIWLWRFGPRGETEDAVPAQLSRHRDWVAVSCPDEGAAAIAADGSIWFWKIWNHPYDWSPSGWLAPSRKPVLVSTVFDQP